MFFKRPFFIVILGSVLLARPSFGRLYLNISIYNKKGTEKGPILASELHSIEETWPRIPILLSMKTGIEVKLIVNFESRPFSYGPGHIVLIRGSIKKIDGEILENFIDTPVFIPLGGKKVITHEGSSQRIELHISPEFYQT